MFRFTPPQCLLMITVALLSPCSSQPSVSRVDLANEEIHLETPEALPTELPVNTRVARTGPFSSQGSAVDYFRGADCYAEKFANCLGVNAELEARAVDPIECKRPEPRVCLVPVGNVRTDVVDAIVKFHKDSKGLDILILPSIAITSSMVDAKTSQVFDIDVRDAMDGRYGVVDTTASAFIAITPVDMKPKSGEYGWVFGVRSGTRGSYNRGVFSYFRMENVLPYDGSPLTAELLGQRVAKYTARYTALLYYRYPLGDDIKYLNYRDMFGFSDLDSMGTRWPVESPPRP